MAQRKIIRNVREAVEYANRLGFAKSSDIVTAQNNLCDAMDDMIEASGQQTYGFRPFFVKYNRNAGMFEAQVVS